MTRGIDPALGGKLQELISSATLRFQESLFCGAVHAQCESEIEGMMSVAFHASALANFNFHSFTTRGWRATESVSLRVAVDGSTQPNVIIVWPQVSIAKYRADFLCLSRIRSLDGEEKIQLLAVECDGHEFHERTKEQAARDRSRDRDLLMMGVPTMRFTGSEIWGDAYDCISQVDNFFLKSSDDFFSTIDTQEG